MGAVVGSETVGSMREIHSAICPKARLLLSGGDESNVTASKINSESALQKKNNKSNNTLENDNL